MARFDTIIRNGTVIDGTRSPRFRADIGIRDGRIESIAPEGLSRSDAGIVLEAEGHVVAPGFIDLHTHYDAQIQWDPYCTLSGWHGVTSLVVGNCGFGFAPVRPEDRDRAMLSMSRVEAVPFESMKQGMLWDWESFPQWLDSLERIPKGVNVLSYVPIAPIMIYVMGLEAAKARAPTVAERAEMCRLLDEGLEAGGCGWSTQRLGDGFTSVQRDYDGTPMVTDLMDDETCLAFADVLRRRGEGFIQLTQAKDRVEEDMKAVEALAARSGCPVLFNVVQVNNYHPHQHRRFLKWIEAAQARGHQVYGQSVSTGNDLTYTFEDFNLLDGQPDWRDVTLGTVAERRSKMMDPVRREALRQDYDHGRMPVATGPVRFFRVQETAKSENRRWEGLTIQELGEAQGRHPIDAFLDLVVDEDLKTTIFTPAFNDDPDLMGEIYASEYTIPGVSDGGAHTKFVTLGRYTTEFLATHCRDRGLMTLEEAHYRLSALPARAAGFRDRGVLAEGRPADVVVYDLDRLACTPAQITRDFPGGEWRRVQKAVGYRYIMVNGTVTFEDGACTNATPGALLRHGRSTGATPSAAA